MLTSMIHYIQWKICLNTAGTGSQLIISTISIHVCWSFVKVCPNKSARPRNVCRAYVNNDDINKRRTARHEIKGLWGSEAPIAVMVDDATCALRSKNATFLIKQNTLNSIFPQTQKILRKASKIVASADWFSAEVAAVLLFIIKLLFSKSDPAV